MTDCPINSDCAQELQNRADNHNAEVIVTRIPPQHAPDIIRPPVRYLCPHGQTYYIYPCRNPDTAWANLADELATHEITVVASPKMDATGLVAAVCTCGYRSAPTSELEARKSGHQHVSAKEAK